VRADGGTLVAQVYDRNKAGLAGVTVSATGPQTLPSYQTSSAGCVEWDYVTPGAYTVTLQESGYVDPDGRNTVTKTVTVVDGGVNTATFNYDRAGTITVKWFTQFDKVMLPYCSATPCPKNYAPAGSGIDQVTVSNSGMSADRIFGTLGTEVPTIATSGDGPVGSPSPGLFPFAAAYTLYPGLCLPVGSGIPPGPPPNSLYQTATVTPGSSQILEVQLPEIDINVTKKITGGSTVPADGARIVLDRRSGNPSCPALRLPNRYADSNGDMPFPGVPSGKWDLCVEVQTGTRYDNKTKADIDVKNFTAPGAVNLTVDTTTATPTGPCA
jgi:hypothetical protein